MRPCVLVVLLLAVAIVGSGQPSQAPPQPPIVLAPDDTPAFPAALTGCDPRRDGGRRGRAEGDVLRSAPAFAVFERDLLTDLIPFVESTYPVKKDRLSRALTGLSMGGGQALNFGLGHLDTFACVGAFSAAPNTRTPEQLVPDPAEASRRLELLWISCGDEDGLIHVSQRTHRYLKEKRVPHVWHVESGGHGFAVWRNDLSLFAQRIFRAR